MKCLIIPPAKEVSKMSEKEKQILEHFGEILPKLNEMEKEKLLSFGEGMAFVKATETAKTNEK